MRLKWTPDMTETALRLRERNVRTAVAAGMCGVTPKQYNTRLSYLRNLEAKREYKNRKARERRAAMRAGLLGGTFEQKPGRPTEAMLADRDRRLGVEPTPNMVVLGDPPPGQSALDRMRGAQR